MNSYAVSFAGRSSLVRQEEKTGRPRWRETEGGGEEERKHVCTEAVRS